MIDFTANVFYHKTILKFLYRRRRFHMQYNNAGSGLNKLFIAQIGTVVSSVLLLIPIVNLIALLAILGFLILSLVGLNEAGKDIAGCKTAFQLTAAELILNILSGILGSGILGTLISAASSVAGFLALYFVCSSVADVLRTRSHDDIASKGELVWKINLVCYAVEIVMSFLAHIPLLNVLAVPAGIIIPVVTIIAGILYIVFLYKSSLAL